VTRRLTLGRITGAQGIKGEVKLQSFTADPLDIASYGPLDTSNGQRLTIRSIKPHKNMLLARIEGVEDRNAAEALRGVELMIDRDRLPAADEDEIYHADLIGLSAHDTGGNLVGTVVDVLDFGAGELLELKPAQGKTFLVPFSVETVPEIDLDAGRLVIDPPEGRLISLDLTRCSKRRGRQTTTAATAPSLRGSASTLSQEARRRERAQARCLRPGLPKRRGAAQAATGT
jgi:16S rRNA processing protein RimM